MTALRWMTAGESHGKMLLGILDGLPAGIPLTAKDLAPRMQRRQGGYGRGQRMTFEGDVPHLVGGIWRGRTNGAPLGIYVENKSDRSGRTVPRKTAPRPGHADLPGMLKYGFDDANPVLERASARETAMRVALGAAACHLLEQLGMRLTGYVREFGGIEAPPIPAEWGPDEIAAARDASAVACFDVETSERIVARVDEARARGETLGGRLELIIWNAPPGLGTYVQWDRRLDGRLAQALMAVQSFKEVEIGDALAASRAFGHDAHDVIVRDGEGLGRLTNRAGGLEGGTTNGEPIVVRAALKPIATQRKPLPTVDIDTGEPVEGRYVRSDVGVVPAAAVIAEAVCGLVLADCVLEKFGGDCLDDVEAAIAAYTARLPRWL